MKNRLKFLIQSCTVLLFLIVAQIGFSQAPVMTINYNGTGLIPGTLIEVPITLNGTQVGNYAFIINYDRDILSYVNFSYVGQYVGTGSVNPNFQMGGQAYLKGIFGYSQALGGPDGATYNNENVFILRFIFNGGTTSFSYVNIAANTSQSGSTYTFIKANPYTVVNIQSTYNVGSVSGDYAVLHSKPAGGNWFDASTWVENKVPSNAHDVFITQDVVTIAPSTTIPGKCHNLTINSGGKLTLNAGVYLNNLGSFTIESGGSFVDNNSSSTLLATVKRNITGNYSGSGPAGPTTVWHYVSSPVSNGVIGSFLGCLLNKWTENAAGGIWDTLYLPLSLPLEVGRGYSVAAFPTFGDAVFTGPLNCGNITIGNLTNSNPNPGVFNNYYGYHLLGNPYPSGFKWDGAVIRNNVDAAAYLWNGSTYIAKMPTDNYEIEAEQGFFVNATQSGASITIPNGNRVHSSGSFLKSSLQNTLSLTVNGNSLSDETSIRFTNDATNGYDGELDAYKLYGVSYCPQIFSIIPDINLAINSMPEPVGQTIIPVGFKTGVSGTFTITASGLESFNTGSDFYLTDLVTGQSQNLNINPVYSFTAYPANPEHRFNLHFAPVGVGDQSLNKNVRIYSFDNSLYVDVRNEASGKVLIFDIMGKEVGAYTTSPNSLNKFDLTVGQGYYLVKFVGENTSVSTKVFIR